MQQEIQNNMLLTTRYHEFDVATYTNYQFNIKLMSNNNIILTILEDEKYGSIKIANCDEHVFEYYNGSLGKITVQVNFDNANYEITMNRHDLPINQIYVNNSLKVTFYDDLVNAYGLKEYHDPYAPSLFYGLFGDSDIKVLENHKSLRVIVWVGGDVNYTINRPPEVSKILKKNLDRILKVPKTRYVSISSFITKSLTSLGLSFKMVPFMGAKFSNFKPVPKGPCIYLYTALSVEKYYGYNFYTRLMKKYENIKFIVTCCHIEYQRLLRTKSTLKYNIKSYSKEELINDIYPQCFIGLRLTDHDGLSGTVQELGLLGIKTVHNGCSPSALNYSSFEDICAHIDREMKTIGQVNVELADQVKKYLTVDPSFFTTNFHKHYLNMQSTTHHYNLSKNLNLVFVSVPRYSLQVLPEHSVEEQVRENQKFSPNHQISINTNASNIIHLSILNDPQFNQMILKEKNNYIINYYNEQMKEIHIKCDYLDHYDIRVEPKNIEIKQIHVSQVLRPAFLEDLKNAYQLVDYYDDNAPAIFYGLMDANDMAVLRKNRSLKVIIWIGGDINFNSGKNRRDAGILAKINSIRKLGKCKHIAISSFIEKNMIDLKLPYQMVPFMGINFDLYAPIPKGSSIYLYTDLTSENTYGKEIYLKLMAKYSNINFIVTCCQVIYDRITKKNRSINYGTKCYQKNELIKRIYPQCFIGLRLTTHDGLAATVQELGLLGIKTIHNGNSPSALHYNNFDDICNHIENEMKNIGQIDYELADNVKKYLTLDPAFFTTDYHS